MRKELLVYVDTAESGESLSASAIASNRDFVVLKSTSGRLTANVKELIEALNVILQFDKENNPTTIEPLEEVSFEHSIEYVDGD